LGRIEKRYRLPSAEVVAGILKCFERGLDVADVEFWLAYRESKLGTVASLPLLSSARLEEESRRHLLVEAQSAKRRRRLGVEPDGV